MDKSSRDALQNAKFEDTYIHTDGMPWTQFSDGIEIKVLRTSQESGTWTTLFRCAKGSSLARHEHLGAGEYLMLSGKMEVRGGVEKGGITAYPGDYGYEPNGMIHDSTCFPEASVFYFTNYGPIRFMDEEDKTIFVLDWKAVAKMGADSAASVRAAE